MFNLFCGHLFLSAVPQFTTYTYTVLNTKLINTYMYLKHLCLVDAKQGFVSRAFYP